LWRAGEGRPTHRQEVSQPRAWRTRKYPFAGVWPKVLLWLQEKPEATATALFERLHREYSGRFPEGQLRTLQRRIREWRRVTARQLVYSCLDSPVADASPMVIGAVGRAGAGESPAEDAAAMLADNGCVPPRMSLMREGAGWCQEAGGEK
jgi:hypothetical protein